MTGSVEPPIPTGSGHATTRLLVGLPTPLAAPLRDVLTPAGSPAERLKLRITFVERLLCVLVAVLDAERVALGLPRPGPLQQLLARLHKPTLGLWAEAASALARALSPQTNRALPDVAAGLLDAQSDLYRGISALVAVRNHLAHGGGLASISEPAAQALLDSSADDLRRLVLGLRPLCDLTLVVPQGTQEDFTGEVQGQVVVHRGDRPHPVELRLGDARLPRHQPVLVTSNGAVLRTFPWLATSEAAGRHEVLVLHALGKDMGPVYRDATSRIWTLEATAQASLSHPEGGADVWFATLPLAPRPERLPPEAVSVLLPAEGPTPPPAVRGLRPVALLGRGGTGAVWKVVDPSRGGADFALKVLHPVLAMRQDHAARLQREHDVLRTLRLPGVVDVEEVFVDPDHGPCLLMEWVRGESLAAHARRRRFETAEAVAIVAALLDTLASVHARGIVHRDIKPSNVLLDGELPRLIDFGIAWVDGAQRLTLTADVVGTRAYAAPEQLRGEAVTRAADLYACGRLLQELLDGPDAPRPSSRRPGPLGPVIRRALQPDPADRYPDASAMAEALRAAQNGEAPACALDVGEQLPGGLRVKGVVGEAIPGLFVLEATGPDGRSAALVAPAPGGGAHAQLLALLARAPDPLKRQHLASRLLHTADGVPYAELWPDDPQASVRALHAAASGAPPPTAAAPASAPAPDQTDDRPFTAGETAAAVGLGAAGLAALAGAAWLASTAASSKKRGGAAGSAASPAPGPSARRNPSGKLGHASAFGAFLGALVDAGARKVHPPAPSALVRAHHGALCLLALESALTGVPLRGATWKKAWKTRLGGLLAFGGGTLHPKAIVQPLLTGSPEWPHIQRVSTELSALPHLPDDRDPRVRALIGFLAAAVQRVVTANSSRGLHPTPLLRIHSNTLQIRRFPSNTGWQVVSLEQAQ